MLGPGIVGDVFFKVLEYIIKNSNVYENSKFLSSFNWYIRYCCT